MSSPWGKIAVPEPANLKDIMFEEIVKENKKTNISTNLHSDIHQKKALDLFSDENKCDPSTDAAIAKLLQQEYDEEYNETLREKEKHNYASMFFISDKKHFHHLEDPDCETNLNEEKPDDDDYDDDETGLHNCDNVISKYDIKIRKEKYTPGTSSLSDHVENDVILPNEVWNSLKLHSKCEQRKRERLHDKKEDKATTEFALDFPTTLQLHKLINKQLLKQINGVISVGKEAVVLHAESDPSYPEATLPKECAIKIYKTTLADFKQREIYIREDKRFAGRIGKQSTRKTIYLWAEKELRNLFRLQKVGIASPQPLGLKQHILVMSFIGENHQPAPKLKYAELSKEEYELAYTQVIEAMTNLYSKAKLIHGDLSEYNILWHDNQCYLIDVSQSVEPTHTSAFHFLMRDCENVTKFFSSKDIPDIRSAQELFIEITGFDYYNRVLMEEACNLSKKKANVMDECDVESNNIFETEWQKIMEEKLHQQEITTDDCTKDNDSVDDKIIVLSSNDTYS